MDWPVWIVQQANLQKWLLPLSSWGQWGCNTRCFPSGMFWQAPHNLTSADTQHGGWWFWQNRKRWWHRWLCPWLVCCLSWQSQEYVLKIWWNWHFCGCLSAQIYFDLCRYGLKQWIVSCPSPLLHCSNTNAGPKTPLWFSIFSWSCSVIIKL